MHRGLRGVLRKKIARLQIGLYGTVKKSIEFNMTRLSRICLDAGHDESNTEYNLYLNSALNWLDSGDSTDIPS